MILQEASDKIQNQFQRQKLLGKQEWKDNILKVSTQPSQAAG